MTNKTVTEQTNELLALKQEAKELNIKFHPNIGFASLQKRIKEEQNQKVFNRNHPEKVVAPPVRAKHTMGRQLTPGEVKKMKRDNALELIRVRVSCMNPNKKDWEGEIFSIGNSEIPTQKKYVPFNISEGWHIPQIMLNMIEHREFQTFITERDHRGRPIRKGVLKKEFSVEVMPPLTAEEISDLKKKQALAAGKVN